MKRIPSDLVIEEIREVRHRISERFNHDPAELVGHYIAVQEQYEDRLLKTTNNRDEHPREKGEPEPRRGGRM